MEENDFLSISINLFRESTIMPTSILERDIEKQIDFCQMPWVSNLKLEEKIIYFQDPSEIFFCLSQRKTEYKLETQLLAKGLSSLVRNCYENVC